MKFENVLDDFRVLGGVANNIDCHESINGGRGLFAFNPKLPIQIHCRPNFLLEYQDIQLDDQKHIKVSERGSNNKEIKSFYEKFHRYFGWSAGGFDEIRGFYNELNLLPDEIKKFLSIFGWPSSSFKKLSDNELLDHYLVSRQININSKKIIMPFIEMINHSPNGNNYVIDDGIKFNGYFNGEIFANYNSHVDMFHFFRNYRFVSVTGCMLSCDMSIDFPSIGRIFISRFDGIVNKDRGLTLPQVKKTEGKLSISFVELFNKHGRAREIFTELMSSYDIPLAKANEIFNGIIEINIQVLIAFLDKSNKLKGRAIENLRTIAKTHLQILN